MGVVNQLITRRQHQLGSKKNAGFDPLPFVGSVWYHQCLEDTFAIPFAYPNLTTSELRCTCKPFRQFNKDPARSIWAMIWW